MATIGAGVGPGQRNDPADIRSVQERLTRHRAWLGGAPPPPVDGRYTLATARAITSFQEHGASLKNPDGIVSPNGFTMTRLDMDVIRGPRHRVFSGLCWAHPNDVLTNADYAEAATFIGCDAAAIQAVAKVEARGSP